MTIWQKFEDPVWRSAAEKRKHTGIGGTWQVESTDSREVRKHKRQTQKFLKNKGLTEETLFTAASPQDIALFHDILKMNVIGWISAKKIAHFNHLKNQVLIKRRALTEEELKQLSYILYNANRKKLRQIHSTEKKTYEQHKEYIEKSVYRYK